MKSYKYSDKGSLGEDGNGKFDYATAIKYTDNASKHILGLPVDVTVTGGDGSLYHHVTAKYNTNYANHITQITQQLNDGAAVTDYKYDSYAPHTCSFPAHSGTCTTCAVPCRWQGESFG